MFWRKKRPFSRTETLAAADKARARGRRKQAIALYRAVLDKEPGDLAVHAKLAPLLARTGQRADALASFRVAADGQAKAGFPDRAISLVRQAADHYPEERGLWDEVARLHVLRGRRADAVAALLAGGRRLHRSGRHPEVAAAVLRRALELEPWQPDATMVLARVLARSRRKTEALSLLDQLSVRVRGKLLRRTRRLAFRISPSPGNLWRWIRAAAGERTGNTRPA
ncbi:MAG TPA: tetratricopeptide repeat protein [Anaeromyxobacteraceae bacterium]|nr:tetratricopeptide repeat protein [Anaeromyxobacteraceae bacterium]